MSSSVLTPVPNHSLFIKRIPFETRFGQEIDLKFRSEIDSVLFKLIAKIG